MLQGKNKLEGGAGSLITVNKIAAMISVVISPPHNYRIAPLQRHIQIQNRAFYLTPSTAWQPTDNYLQGLVFI